MADYIALYSIYRALTKWGFRDAPESLKTKRKYFLEQCCTNSTANHRFSARNEAQAKSIASVRKDYYSTLDKVVLVELELLKIGKKLI
jgi:hypothetical protein